MSALFIIHPTSAVVICEIELLNMIMPLLSYYVWINRKISFTSIVLVNSSAYYFVVCDFNNYGVFQHLWGILTTMGYFNKYEVF